MVLLVVWFVNWFICLFCFFLCNVKLQRANLLVKEEERQVRQSPGFNKSTHLKVPGLDLHAKFHVKGSLSHHQTCWHILHTHQVWSCECLEWSTCRKLGWDGPPLESPPVMHNGERENGSQRARALLCVPQVLLLLNLGFLFLLSD